MPGVMIEPDDICLFVTEACNSNCIMCPMSADSRRRGISMSAQDFQQWSNYVPVDARHITITGGEPFLEYEKLLTVVKTINKLFPDAEVLILTNGRILSIPKIFDAFVRYFTDRYCLAIPVHAPNEELHDRITKAPGSFQQTMKAMKLLSTTPVKIEARIVGHQHNLEKLNDTFKMLVHSDARIDVINLIAMEMTGCAGRFRDELWVDYREVCNKSRSGILYSILHGINVGLYNFPLCTVPQHMWSLVKDSITPSKVRYAAPCAQCREKHACGGLFYSTYELNLCSVQPIIEDKTK